MSTFVPQRHLPEILHLRRLRMRVVGDGARCDLRVLGTGEPQELVDLVAGNVGDDASGPVAVVKPFRTSLTTCEMGTVALPVGSESQSLHNASYPPLSH